MSVKKCPDCKETELCRADRRGIEIDYCPDCNGIWLDSGELRKIVDASLKAAELEDKIAPAAKKESSLKSFLSFLGKTKVDMDSGCNDDSGGCDNK